jgi:hypothetical protein
MALPDPIKNDRRRARRQAALPADACCVLCPESAPEALLMVERSLLEAHHPLGEGIAPELTVPLCRNCHAAQTEAQLAVGVEFHRSERSLLATVASVACALGVFLQALAERLLAWAQQLRQLESTLDQRFAGWRELPEARG